MTANNIILMFMYALVDVHICTLHTVPSQPRDLVVSYSSVSSDTLEVTWIPPLCDNGVRTQYTVSI